MFKWWNEPILPRSSIKWNYVVGFSVVWLTGKYYLQRTFSPAVASLDALAILFACVALAVLQSTFSKQPPTEPEKTEQEKAMEQKDKQRKQKAKRHP